MSINSVSSRAWPQPYPSPTPTAGTDPSGVSVSTSSGRAPPAPGQELGANVRAILVTPQSQPTNSVSGTSGSASSTFIPATLGGNSGSMNPVDQLATDTQAIYSQVQAGDTSSTASVTSTTVGQTQPRPHHHGGGTEPGATGSSPAVSTTTGSYSIQSVSQSVAADVLQALQSYGNLTSTTQTPGITA